jgi:hypothetical protein
MRQKRILIIVAVWLAAIALGATGCSSPNGSGNGTNNGGRMMNRPAPNTNTGPGMMNRGGSTTATYGP